MQLHERIRYIRKQRGWTQEAMASLLDVQPITVTRWESDPGKPNARNADYVTQIAICTIADASIQWLSKGVGEPFPTELKWQQGTVLNRPLLPSAAAFAPESTWPAPPEETSCYPLRCSEANALLAATGGGTDDDLYWIKACGDAMSPTVMEGELVLLNTALPCREHPRNHGLYLVRRAPSSIEARLKRLRLDLAPGKITLMSDNQSFPAIEIDPHGVPLPQFILGRVVLLQRHLTDLDPQESDW